MNYQDISDEIIEAVVGSSSITTKQELQKAVHIIAAKYKLPDSPPVFQLLKKYRD